MDQKVLMDLLREASNPSCASIRREKIAGAIIFAARQNPENQEVEMREIWGQDLVSNIFWHNLTHLPELFPFFAILCGEREGKAFAGIDWSICESTLAEYAS